MYYLFYYIIYWLYETVRLLRLLRLLRLFSFLFPLSLVFSLKSTLAMPHVIVFVRFTRTEL